MPGRGDSFLCHVPSSSFLLTSAVPPAFSLEFNGDLQLIVDGTQAPNNPGPHLPPTPLSPVVSSQRLPPDSCTLSRSWFVTARAGMRVRDGVVGAEKDSARVVFFPPLFFCDVVIFFT